MGKEKFEKTRKKVLTIRGGCGIISERSRESSKNSEKSGWKSEPDRWTKKAAKKIRKKCLTNWSECGKIVKRSRERPTGWTKSRVRGPWKLNNVTKEGPVISESLNSKNYRKRNLKIRIYEANASKWANKGSKIDLKPKGFRYHILESLILAQDERWRRA